MSTLPHLLGGGDNAEEEVDQDGDEDGRVDFG